MKKHSQFRTAICLALFTCAFPLSARCAGGRIVALGAAPPKPFLDAAQAAGYTVVPSDTFGSDADIAILDTPVEEPRGSARLFDSAAAWLARGKTLIVALGDRPETIDALGPLLPINLWSASGGDGKPHPFVRPGCGFVMDAASPLPGKLNLQGLQVIRRYDLHLPYAAMEAGEHRYSWRKFEKELLDSDWSVPLRCDREGQLPMLVSGRYGPGKVIVFGADLYDASLIAGPSYADFVTALLALAGPEAKPASASLAGMTVSIPAQQLGPLHVRLTNSSPAVAVVLLAYKVSNAEHALLNSATLQLEVPGGGSIDVPLVERSSAQGDGGIHASADSTVNFRWVRAGLATLDRTQLIGETVQLVDTSPALTLAIEGQDIRSQPDVMAWPDREMSKGSDSAGGAPIYRYVYTTGMAPELHLVIRNGLHNIAPLATPTDLDWPENPTAQGLNDMAYSHGSLRGNYPLYADWAGKSASHQDLSFKWPFAVTVAGQQLIGQTAYRRWDRTNPLNYRLDGLAPEGTKTLVDAKAAAYENARHADWFPASSLMECRLHIVGLDASLNAEPHPLNDVPTNCSLTEWEVLGWPSSQPPPRATGQLTVTLTDLLTKAKSMLLQEPLAVDALQQAVKAIHLPAKNDFGPVRVDADFAVDGGGACTASFDVLFVPPGRKAIEQVPHTTMGLLCSPGFIVFDEFGKGTLADTQGWGGDDDKIWALTHDFMELGARATDSSTRLFTTSARFCHYTDPWRDFPSGQYFWDWAGDQLVKQVTTGKLKGTKHVHIFLSDRWNGIPVGAAFTWADFIGFDQFLRKSIGHGLQGRSRQQIDKEITSQYGDLWQKWEMNRYADELLAVQDKLAKVGVEFTVTTHGSFPLVGGELGEKIGKTHVASGTDLFWDLRKEDLYYSLGQRFGLIAANPDYESGAYNEWGWDSAILNNPHWFSYTGTVEPSRRQWYSIYFAGRITSNGGFEPLTVYGYYAQGDFGVENTENDWRQYYRTMHFTSMVRPEVPAGIGMVVSWDEQLRHMGKQAGELGTGLYVAKGYDNVDALAGDVYGKLVKSGVPIAYVASTHTLRDWKGTTPLIVIDGFGLQAEEIADLDRLNRAGAPIISIGAGDGASAAASSLFGVVVTEGGFSAVEGTDMVRAGNTIIAYISRRPGRGATVFCPLSGKEIDSDQALVLSHAILGAVGDPLEMSTGIVATPFISNDRLFLTLDDQGDLNREIEVALRPALLDAAYTGEQFRVVDMDNSREVPARWEGGRLTFTLPMPASAGRLVMIARDQ